MEGIEISHHHHIFHKGSDIRALSLNVETVLVFSGRSCVIPDDMMTDLLMQNQCYSTT